MKRSKIAVFLAAMIVTVSCNQDILDKRNPNDLTPEKYFKTAAEMTKAVNSIYALIQSNNLVGREYFFLHDLRSDDMASGGGQLEVPRNQILTGSQTASNAVSESVWNGLYHSILRANTVINFAPKSEDPAILKAIGEAKFLRAWCYMELVTLWGGVPLQTSVATSISQNQPRASEAEVYSLIKQDLTDAQLALPVKHENEQGRATKGAAQMLQARAYINQGDYTSAKNELEKMTALGVYNLKTIKYADNFREENEWNKESVFEVGFSSAGDVNWMGDGDDPSWGAQERSTRTQEYSPTGWRNVIPSNSIIAEFESTTKGDPKTDPRRAYTFWITGDKYNNGANTLTDNQVQGNTSTLEGATTKVSWAKYSILYKADPGGYGTSGINHRIMRYADAILMLAECENELGNLNVAVGYLNQVRNRDDVQMPPYPTANYPVSNKDEVFKAVVHERRVELAGEQVRARDILRWRRNNKIKIDPIAGFKELLPIPQSEIDNNDKIEQKDQNPGY